MDEQTKILIFVNEFCNRLDQTARGIRHMHDWYLFSDKRPGSIRDRFEADAKDYYKYQKLFQV